MLDDLTSVQLSEWQAYDQLDPIGEWRGDFRMAYLCSIVTNLARMIHGKEGIEMSTHLDFMPEWDKEDIDPEEMKRQTTEQMKRTMFSIMRRQNKNVERKKRSDRKLRKEK